MNKVLLFVIFQLLLISNGALQAQWMQTSGPPGGRITSLASDGKNIFAGDYRGGIYQSTDNGLKWHGVTNGLALNSGISAIGLNGSNLLAGLTDPASSSGNGVYLSTNNGTTWTQVLKEIGTKYIHAFAFSGNTILAGTQGGIYISTDNGSTWVHSNNGIPSIEIFSFTNTGNNIFAGTTGGPSGPGGIYLSTDNGISWQPANNGLLYKPYNSLSLKNSYKTLSEDSLIYYRFQKSKIQDEILLPLRPSVFALISNGNNIFAGTTQGVYVSTNNGDLWTLVTDGLVYGENVYAFATIGDSLFAGTSGGIYVTTNSGILWEKVDGGPPASSDVRSLTVNSGNLLAGTYAGIYLSTDTGLSWNESNYGLASSTVYAMTIKGNKIFTGTRKGIYISTDNGISWTSSNNGIYGNVAEFVVSDGNIFTGGAGVNLSVDDGATWNPIGMNDAVIFALAVKGDNLFVGTLYGVYRSTDGGKAWSLLDNGINPLVNYYAIEFTGNNIFAAGSDPNDGANYDYISTDNGDSWNPVQMNMPVNDFAISTATIGDTIIAGTYAAGVYFSSNNGINWSPINKGISQSVVRTVVIHDNNIFLAIDPSGGVGGVYYSSNYGTDWVPMNNGLTELWLGRIAFNKDNMFIASGGSGVWRHPIADILPVELISFTASYINNAVLIKWNTVTEINSSTYDIERKKDIDITWEKIATIKASGSSTTPRQYSFADENVNTARYNYRLKMNDLDGSSKYSDIINVEVSAPAKYELSNAYPDPWNPATTIRYVVPENILVTIKVYDALGREAANLVNEVKPAGNYEVTFSGKGLASGVYFYKMEAGKFNSVKKMILIK